MSSSYFAQKPHKKLCNLYNKRKFGLRARARAGKPVFNFEKKIKGSPQTPFCNYHVTKMWVWYSLNSTPKLLRPSSGVLSSLKM